MVGCLGIRSAKLGNNEVNKKGDLSPFEYDRITRNSYE